MLKDSALTCIPPFISLVAGPTATKAKEVLNLIANYADAREVTLALNLQLGDMAERADPFVVSDEESDDEEDTEINWQSTFPQLEQLLSMYAAGRIRPAPSDSSDSKLEDSEVNAYPFFTAGRSPSPAEKYSCFGTSRNGDNNVAGTHTSYLPLGRRRLCMVKDDNRCQRGAERDPH